MEQVKNIHSVVLGIVKGRDCVNRNQIINTDTPNTFCEI